MKFFAILSAAVVSVSAATIAPRSGTPMTQAAAQAKLLAAGIHASSSGGCTTKSNPSCTSYSGILSGTVNKVIALKKACGCTITITGGTEVGHHDGRRSHSKGFKVDIRHASGIDAYVKKTYKKIGTRGDGSPQWRSSAGDIYADEDNHWDVTYL
ncbi:hypothetical protein BDV93DRAFT_552189 [Ceratobasidium sp. AG-I]|nr:hypothetical protein BDV93DRAFT_552189 [Ceratobasidium sp. AG-I]